MRSVTLRQLRAYSLVAQHHSFTQAASALHLSTSAVSLQIKELELALGLALFERHSKTVDLTVAGERLLIDVHRALEALQSAEDTLARLRGHERGVVCVGMVSSAKYFLPRLLADFHEQNCHVELKVSVGNREQLVERLRRGHVDLAVMGTPPVDMETAAQPFAPQPLGIVAAPAHALSRHRAISIGALAGCEFIIREAGSGTRAAMERFFRSAMFEPSRAIQMTGNGVIKEAVMANMGVAFISLHAAAPELRQGTLVALDVVGLPLDRRWFVLHLPSMPLIGAARSLHGFISERGGEYIDKELGTAVQPPHGIATAADAA
jgi:DNA-binding transcriptional LysR family regulator